MHTEHHRCGCEGRGGGNRGPELYYGYCHDSGRMRMMNYPDYVQNMQTGLSNIMQGTTLQSMLGALGATAPTGTTQMYGGGYRQEHGHHHHHHHDHDHDCGCGSGERHDHCGCHCCVECADLVEYARCGEVRRIPITFDNDTRRERKVKLTLGAFATRSGQETGWATQLSDTEFTLGPCGEKTIVVSVTVDCSKIGTVSNPTGATNEQQRGATVDSCKVVYASLTAEGCSVRPIVLAVAVLPEHCNAHQASCGCGCCH